MKQFRRARCVVVLAALIFATPAGLAQTASCSVVDLTCEYLQNPLGIDVVEPRLGWKLSDLSPEPGATRQTGFQIMVAGERGTLDRGRGDLWDTGWSASSRSQLVEYRGKPLRSGQTCWWKVRVKDENGRVSRWSAPAMWSMGLLNPQDWKAHWIGTDMVFRRQPGQPPPDNALPDPWLRKTFNLDAVPERALLYVASVGYHEVYVNGRKVGDDVLAPCVTDHTKRARYLAYDIGGYLRAGQNAIGLWLGFSWSIFPPYQTPDKPGSPIVIAQAEIELPGGRRQQVVSDASWRWHPSPNTTIGVWDFMHYGGERYDANRELPDWSEASCDDSAWEPAKVFEPHLMLSAQKVEPNRRVKVLKPASLKEDRTGVWRVDMGQNFTGWIEVKVAGSPGDQIEFKWSERAERDMTHELHSFYTLGPSGKGVFCNRFNYGVGRWIEIVGLRQKPELSDIRGWLIRTDYQRATTFACSSALLNQIFETTLWTYENLSLGGYVVDCAQRERMGYGGDAHATTATSLDCFKTAALYSKWAEDWRDVQGRTSAWGVDKKPGDAGAGKQVEPGNLPYTAPTYWGGGGPGWSGYCITLPWEMYRRFGDRRILQEMFPTIEAWLGFLQTKAKNNLLRRYGGEWDFLGDWLWPGAGGIVNGDTRETLFFNNCYWVYNLQTAAGIAEVLGQNERALAWRARADSVRAAVHKEFFNASDNSYVNGFEAYLAIALLTGVPPEESRPAVAKRLEQEILARRHGHFWAGITGGSFLVRELIQSNRPDLMLTMASKEDYPSWGQMLKQGATTIWEDWEGKLSLCHSSYLHVGAWFVEGLAGIQPGPAGQGYQDFIIRPGYRKGCPLEWMRCRFDSPYGIIESGWRHQPGGIRYEFVVPPNSSATLFLPDTGGKVTQEDRSSAQAKGMRQEGGPLHVFRLGPGPHRFTARFP